jgi:hypothetical protein
MKASRSSDGNVTLQMRSEEAEGLQKNVKVAIAALVTLYARADMKEAKEFFIKLNKALEELGET